MKECIHFQQRREAGDVCGAARFLPERSIEPGVESVMDGEQPANCVPLLRQGRVHCLAYLRVRPRRREHCTRLCTVAPIITRPVDSSGSTKPEEFPTAIVFPRQIFRTVRYGT